MKSNFENTQNQLLSQYSQSSQSNNFNSQANEYGEYFNSQMNDFSQSNQASCKEENYCNDIDNKFNKVNSKNVLPNNCNYNQEYLEKDNKSIQKQQPNAKHSIPYTQEINSFNKGNSIIHHEVDDFYKNYNFNMSNLKSKLLLSYDKLEEETVSIINYHKKQLISKLSLVDKIIDLEVLKIKDSNENVIVINEKINFLFKQLLEVIKTINN
jgi:hypothetical protein